MNKLFVKTLNKLFKEENHNNGFKMSGLAVNENENFYYCHHAYYTIKFNSNLYKDIYTSKIPVLIGKENKRFLELIIKYIKDFKRYKYESANEIPTKEIIQKSIDNEKYFIKNGLDFPVITVDKTVVVNSKYLRDIIILLGGDIKIKVSANNRPIKIKGSNGTALLCPVVFTEERRKEIFGV